MPTRRSRGGPRDPTGRPSPVLVAGMHRSGTSLAASCLSALGVDLGESIPPDRRNPRGYFEDASFLDLNRRILDAVTPQDDGGHRDWGWTESERLGEACRGSFMEEAAALLRARQNAHPWGFKDPRSTVLLDFWNQALRLAGLGEARFLFLYRYPWDVADSMQRLGADVFLQNPDYAYRIWEFYNRRLLEFRRRHAERVLLISVNAVVRRPERFERLLREAFDLGSGGHLPEIDTALLTTVDGDDPLIRLAAGAFPGSADLLAELDAEADLPAAGLWHYDQCAAETARSDRQVTAPDVSVVIPCRDHGVFALEAVASVERADLPTWELVVVDDGSRQPKTLEILELLSREGYTVIRQQNRGLPVARNRGIAEARGRYILPLDADNRLLPAFPAAAARVLDENPEVGVVYGDCREFGQRSGRREPPAFDLETLLRGNYIDACAMFRKELWQQVGGYDPELPAWEDWDFWIGAAERGWRFHRLPSVTFEYRVRPGSLVSRAQEPRVREQIVGHVVDKHRGLFEKYLGRYAGNLHAELAERDCRIQDLAAVAASRDRELEAAGRRLAEVETTAHSLRSELAEAETTADSLRSELAGAEATAHSLRSELAEAEATADSLRSELAERDRAVDELETRLEDRDRAAAALEERLAEERRQADELGETARAAREEARSLADDLRSERELLAKIFDSLGWRSLGVFWRLRDRLLPDGSRRRRWYDRFMARFKARA